KEKATGSAAVLSKPARNSDPPSCWCVDRCVATAGKLSCPCTLPLSKSRIEGGVCSLRGSTLVGIPLTSLVASQQSDPDEVLRRRLDKRDATLTFQIVGSLRPFDEQPLALFSTRTRQAPQVLRTHPTGFFECLWIELRRDHTCPGRSVYPKVTSGRRSRAPIL